GGDRRRHRRRRQPRRGRALRPAGESRARVQPPRRRDVTRAAGARAGPGGARLNTVTAAAPPRAAGVLVVLPPRAADQSLGRIRVAGLPVARRLVLAATSAGYARIFTDERAVDAASLEGTAACRWPETIPLASVPQRLVLVPANLVVQRRWLRDLLDAPLEPETLYIDGSLAAVVETKRVPEVLAAARAGDAADVLERLRGTFDAGTLPADGSGVRPLASAADVGGAESW